jgi:hypothetical protein
MNFRSIAAIAAFLLFAPVSFAQSVIVTNLAVSTQDTTARKQLISSLEGFLKEKDGPAKENHYILKESLPETSVLLDEMKDIEQSAKFNDKNFYKCHLTNIVKQDDGTYLVQFSYLGVGDGTPFLRASYRMLAKNVNGQFYFYSPLRENTRYWKSKKVMNVVFHYKDTLIRKDAEVFWRTATNFDKRLGIPYSPFEFYYCDNFQEAQQILGLDYRSDYNGVSGDIMSGRENNISVMVSGYNSYGHRFDAHDLWHDRLRVVMNGDTINRPVDEGCAYLYGGSWGVSWRELLAKFKQYAADHPDADWLSLYTGTKNFVDGDKSMKVPYVLNALIVQKIEREKGFPPVMQLLGCGKRQAGDDNYFAALEKVTGITKANFNEQMWALIKYEEMSSHAQRPATK